MFTEDHKSSVLNLLGFRSADFLFVLVQIFSKTKTFSADDEHNCVFGIIQYNFCGLCGSSGARICLHIIHFCLALAISLFLGVVVHHGSKSKVFNRSGTYNLLVSVDNFSQVRVGLILFL